MAIFVVPCKFRETNGRVEVMELGIGIGIRDGGERLDLWKKAMKKKKKADTGLRGTRQRGAMVPNQGGSTTWVIFVALTNCSASQVAASPSMLRR